MKQGPLHRAARVVLRGALGLTTRIFFRELAVVGAPPRAVAGRLFAANHWNGIVDPLVILTTAAYDASPIAKSPLFETPVLRTLLRVADAVPVTRRRDDAGKAAGSNEAVFDRVAEHLAHGGNILIFPEGTSHSEPHVLPLKTGAARMLARAHALGARGLSLQTVALDFDAKDTFRSRAVVTYGPVHEIDALAAAAGEGAGERMVQLITERATEDLDALVISGQSRGELLRIRQLAEILAHEADEGSLASQAEIARVLVTRARDLGPSDARYHAVESALTTYVAARRALGLTDAQVAREEGAAVDLGRVARGIGLSLLTPLALLGALLYFVPYRLPRLAHRLARGEGDVVSTYKLGIGLVVFPLWTALLLIATLVATHGRIPPALLVLLAPFAALLWLDRLDDRRGRRLLEAASQSGQRKLARLRLLRRRVLDAVATARDPQEARDQTGGR